MRKLRVLILISGIIFTAVIVAGAPNRFRGIPPNLYIEINPSFYLPFAFSSGYGSNLRYGVVGTPVSVTGVTGTFFLVTNVPLLGFQQVVTTTF